MENMTSKEKFELLINNATNKEQKLELIDDILNGKYQDLFTNDSTILLRLREEVEEEAEFPFKSLIEMFLLDEIYKEVDITEYFIYRILNSSTYSDEEKREMLQEYLRNTEFNANKYSIKSFLKNCDEDYIIKCLDVIFESHPNDYCESLTSLISCLNNDEQKLKLVKKGSRLFSDFDIFLLVDKVKNQNLLYEMGLILLDNDSKEICRHFLYYINDDKLKNKYHSKMILRNKFEDIISLDKAEFNNLFREYNEEERIIALNNIINANSEILIINYLLDEINKVTDSNIRDNLFLKSISLLSEKNSMLIFKYLSKLNTSYEIKMSIIKEAINDKTELYGIDIFLNEFSYQEKRDMVSLIISNIKDKSPIEIYDNVISSFKNDEEKLEILELILSKTKDRFSNIEMTSVINLMQENFDNYENAFKMYELIAKISNDTSESTKIYMLIIDFIKNKNPIKQSIILKKILSSNIDSITKKDIEILFNKALSKILKIRIFGYAFKNDIAINCEMYKNFLSLFPLKKANELAKNIGFSYDTEKKEWIVNERYNFLKQKNNEIDETLDFHFLNKKYNLIDDYNLILLTLDRSIQKKIIALDDLSFALFARIINAFGNIEIDRTGLIDRVLRSLEKKYIPSFINKENISKLSNEQILNLYNYLTNTSYQKNIEIISSNDLFDNIYNQKLEKYYEELTNNNIIEIKIHIISKLGLDVYDAQFLLDRYCSNIKYIKNSKNLEPKVKDLLLLIYEIMHETDLNVLKAKYKNIAIQKYDFSVLEATIRSKFAKLYNKDLYNLADHQEDLLANNSQISSETKDTILSSLEGDVPNIYVPNGDFRMIVHALWAYRNEPSNLRKSTFNYNTDWNRPLIRMHAFSTSYISNDLMAIAYAPHPVYGFAGINNTGLVCAGNYDLYSDTSIKQYTSSLANTYNMLEPEVMKNATKHNHNEVVLERLDVSNNYEVKKRIPDYIIYPVDDINDPNFFGDYYIWQETLKASKDFNKPIIILDRLSYAKREYKKCTDNVVKLKECIINQDYLNFLKIFEDLFSCLMNNFVGCRCFEDKILWQNFLGNDIYRNWHYCRFFSRKSVNEILNQITNIAYSSKDVQFVASFLNKLKKLVEEENYCYNANDRSTIQTPPFDLNNEIMKIDNILKEINDGTFNFESGESYGSKN